LTAKIENRNSPIRAQERKQCMTSELTLGFEIIEMYKNDYSLAWKLERWKQTIWQ